MSILEANGLRDHPRASYALPEIALPPPPDEAETLFGVGHVYEIAQFIRSIREGAHHRYPRLTAPHLMAVLAAAYASAEDDRDVDGGGDLRNAYSASTPRKMRDARMTIRKKGLLSTRSGTRRRGGGRGRRRFRLSDLNATRGDLRPRTLVMPLRGLAPVREGNEDCLQSLYQATRRGLPVKVFYEDSQENPALDVTLTKKLIEQNHVHLLAGAMLAFEGLAMVPTIAKSKIALLCMTVVTADEYRKIRSPYISLAAKRVQTKRGFRLGTYAYRTLKYRKAAVVCQDYAWGWQTCGGFEYAFEHAGARSFRRSLLRSKTRRTTLRM